MLSKSRLFLAVSACLLLSNCGLINTALRLAPYALLFADEPGKGAEGNKAFELRGKQVEDKGAHGIRPTDRTLDSGLAFKR